LSESYITRKIVRSLAGARETGSIWRKSSMIVAAAQAGSEISASMTGACDVSMRAGRAVRCDSKLAGCAAAAAGMASTQSTSHP